MDKRKMIGILALAVILASLLGVQQGYAAKTVAPPGTYRGGGSYVSIGSVSNPSGGCANLGLNHGYGTVTVAPHGVVIFLHNAAPRSTYGVSVGYVQDNGGCEGTWKSVGFVTTNDSGIGTLAQRFNLASSHNYIFEFNDNAGNIVYATAYLAL